MAAIRNARQIIDKLILLLGNIPMITRLFTAAAALVDDELTTIAVLSQTSQKIAISRRHHHISA